MARQRLETDQRRLDIVLAAIDLADARDVESIITLEAAHGIGVTQRAVFRHLSTRESVYRGGETGRDRLISVTAAEDRASARCENGDALTGSTELRRRSFLRPLNPATIVS